MSDEQWYVAWWPDVRGPEPRLPLRFALSIAAGVGLAAVALLALGLLANWIRRGIRDEEIALALLIASVAWCGPLYVIWRPLRRGRPLLVTAVVTVVIGLAVVAALVAIDLVMRVREEELVMSGVALLGAAGVILLWTAAIGRFVRGRPVVGADHQVQVFCPGCNYSLIGLRDLRCPECGREFTIDELIRAQRYETPPPSPPR